MKLVHMLGRPYYQKHPQRFLALRSQMNYTCRGCHKLFVRTGSRALGVRMRIQIQEGRKD